MDTHALTDQASHLADRATVLVNSATDQAAAAAQRSVDLVRDGSRLVRDKAARASYRTTSYIKDEPVKAVLIAAATGAALMALVNLLGHSRNRH